MSHFPSTGRYVARARGCRDMAVTVDNGVVCATGTNGLRVSIQVDRLIAIHRGDRITIPYYSIDCVLANGMPLECEGYMESGSIRIDAVDQENHSDFWLTIERV